MVIFQKYKEQNIINILVSLARLFEYIITLTLQQSHKFSQQFVQASQMINCLTGYNSSEEDNHALCIIIIHKYRPHNNRINLSVHTIF